jgi:hypothetical protein
VPNLKARVKKLRDQVELMISAGDLGYPESCICFPQSREAPKPGVSPLVFGSSEDVMSALTILCPLHGRRFDPSKVMVLYAAKWVRKRNWESQWDHLPTQYRKAVQATFKNREEYVGEAEAVSDED